MSHKVEPDWLEHFEQGMQDAFNKIDERLNMSSNYHEGYKYGKELLEVDIEKLLLREGAEYGK